MKHIVPFLLVLLFPSFVFPGTQEVSKWTENTGNPVFDPTEKAYYPTVVKISDSDYRMWYGSTSGVGYAVSANGTSWSEITNPVSGLTNAHHPVVRHYPDGFNSGGITYYFRIWYWDTVQLYSINAIRYAESADGQNWENDQALTGNIITGIWPDWNRGSYGPIDIFNNASATNTGTNPFDYSFTMYFDGTTGSYEEIGLAYSSDGKNWSLYGKVLARGNNGTGAQTEYWDSHYTTFGSIIKESDTRWHMFYSGGQYASNEGIGYAYSTDGLNWVKSGNNPILHKNDGVAWRNDRTYTPVVIKDGSAYKMWFTGKNAAGNYTVGYATNSNPGAEYISIQEALDAAGAGDSVKVYDGTFTESLVVNKRVILVGTVRDENITTKIYPDGNAPIIELTGSGLSQESQLVIKNFHLYPNYDYGAGKDGIKINDGVSVSYVQIDNVYFTGTNRSYPGLESGIYVDMDASASDLTITNCKFTELAYGLTANKSASSSSAFSDITISNSTFQNNISKGMYFEKLSNAVISTCTFSNNGNKLLAADWAKEYISALDINLKYGSYSNITLSGLSFSNNGIDATYGTALTVKARGTGNDPSYSSNPAELSNVTITESTFENNETDIRIGEPGKNNTSPLLVKINENKILGTPNGLRDERAAASDTINAAANWWGTSQPSVIITHITGSVDYSPWWGDNYVNDPHTSPWTWYVNNSSKSTIQEAINSAGSGDTITVFPGTYTEHITINKMLSLQSSDPGNKAIINGSGTRTTITASNILLKDLIYDLSGETITDGVIVIERGGTWPAYSIQCADITLSGVEVLGGRRALFATVSNITIENSRFVSQYRDALFFNAVSGTTTIRNNYFFGAEDSKKSILFENLSSTDPPASGSILIEKNNAEGKRNFMVYNQWMTPEVPIKINITDNDIAPYGTAISVYDPREYYPEFDPANFLKIDSVDIKSNRFDLNTDQLGVECPVEIVDKVTARRNWWGNSGNPKGKLSLGVSSMPWCLNSDCTKFSKIKVASNDSVQIAINSAEPNDTVYVDLNPISKVFKIDRDIFINFNEPPVIDSFEVTNGNLTLSSDITISGGILLSKGNIITGANNKIIFNTTAKTLIENAGSKIIGTVQVLPRDVGLGQMQLLGLKIHSGVDNLGKVELIRKSGDDGIVTVSDNSGIAMKWEINAENQPTNGRTITFEWLPEFDNGVNLTNVVIYRNTGLGWQYFAGPLDAAGDPRSISITITGFSDWTIGDGDSPLPVELISFTAGLSKSAVILKWETATEVNNYGFEIERSLVISKQSLVPWEKIGFVQGSGNSNALHKYQFVDKNPSGNRLQYRLKQIDTDGSFSYSDIQEIKFNLPVDLELFQNYPNPFNPVTTIKYAIPFLGDGKSMPVQIKLYNILGSEIITVLDEPKEPGIYDLEFDGSNLSSGIYFYILKAGKFTETRKLILLK